MNSVLCVSDLLIFDGSIGFYAAEMNRFLV